MYFIDCETHLWPPFDDISYFPNYKKFMTSARRLAKLVAGKEGALSGKRVATADAIIEAMNEGGIAKACALPEIMLAMSHGHKARSTNGWVAMEIEKYPERLIGVANVGPISLRGEDAVWELKYLVQERGYKACKVYPVDDCPINDKRMWPLYETVRDLGIVLFVHTGFSLVKPGRSAYCHPMLLEEVCDTFPEIPIVAYHMGYPYHRELIMLALLYGNLYLGTSLLSQLTRFNESPTLFAEIIGEAIAYAGADKLIYGTDWSGSYLSMKETSDLVRNYQIPEDVQKRYGYKPITDEDRRKWAGLNLAKILKIEVKEEKK